jgi:hypothetical protein
MRPLRSVKLPSALATSVRSLALASGHVVERAAGERAQSELV